MNPLPSIPQPANHPPRCKRCNGAGWEPSDPIHGGVQGHPHTWTFVTPCTHDWWHDDTGWDPYTDDLLPWHDPRARTAYEAGYEAGQLDLYEMSDGRLGQPPHRKELTA